MKRRIRTIAVLPTLFTVGNVICGFFAIVTAARIDPLHVSDYDAANVMLSGWLIFGGMIFDALDGQVARLARVSSDFGAQLDSLCDVVTFGVAPAFLLVKMCPDFHILERPPMHPLFPGIQTIWVIAALHVACAAMRLARFNVETEEDDDHMTFNGLPSPAAAATIASFAIMFYTLRKGETWWLGWVQDLFNVDQVLQTVLPFFGACLALLMVSRIPYPHLVNQFVRGNRSFGHVVGVVVMLMAILMTLPYSVPAVCCVFVLYGPIKNVWDRIWDRRAQEEPMF